MQHFSNPSSSQSRSPLSHSSHGFGPQPQRFQDYSPLQSVNLGKYNFDYERGIAPSGTDLGKAQFNDPMGLQALRLREALSNDQIRAGRLPGFA